MTTDETAPTDAYADPVALPALPPAVLEGLEPHLPAIVSEFYDRIARRPQLKAVLERLTDDELSRLEERQAGHLRDLLRPHLDTDALRQRSREIGRVHALTGVELDWYVQGVAEHRHSIWAAIERLVEGDPSYDRVDLHQVLVERFMADLHGTVVGYREIEQAESRLLLDVLRVVGEAMTVADLSRGLVETLGRLDGVSVVMFARPDADGDMANEVGGGRGFDTFLELVSQHDYAPVTTRDDLASGRGPIGRAWRGGRIERSDSLMTDPTAQPWRDLATEMRWGSSAAVPLVDRNGRTRALVSLLAGWTGYFASEARLALLAQVKEAAERALVELEEQPSLATGVRGFADRARHLALLSEGAVEMVYQPVISLPGGRLVKLEALARLRDGDRLMSPVEFLPSYGDEELLRLFELGLHQAMTALRAWERQGLTTGVSLNLPVVSVTDQRYARLVSRALPEFGVAPHRITLELLETGYVDREAHRRRLSLDDFKVLGVRLAQDDLGSGYSSLLRLRNFAFDEAKIDQSLVRGTELAPGAALHFIQPMTDIAHSLGLNVVIEGLESDGLIEAAVQLGVDAGQGYGIARPMPVDEVVPWAASYHLDVDPCSPRTALGALAGHVAWENRVTALGDHVSREHVLGIEKCVLTGYVARHVDGEFARRTVEQAHLDVHSATLSGRGGEKHRSSWERLAQLLAPA